jgi:hypothetical protein
MIKPLRRLCCLASLVLLTGPASGQKGGSPVRYPVDLGDLDGFYRHTQLQGHLVEDGLHLYEVPAFWLTGSDFPYLKKASDREVFFVDEFSITRFLGGFPPRWKHNGRELPENDLAYEEDGKVKYRLDKVDARLRPYIDNGYTTFTIGIENVPWALASDPTQVGPFGQKSPPRDWQEWHDFVLAVCGEMKRVWPESITSRLSFKIGNEYNGAKSWSGNHEDFEKLYDWSAAAIMKVFPEADIMPGEIGGQPRSPENRVDYPDLFEHFARGKNHAGLPGPSPVAVLARSSHSFPHMRDVSPRERIRSAVDSFKTVLAGKPSDMTRNLGFEYHQFGVLGTPFSESAYAVDARSGSWQFQTLFLGKASGYLDRAWAWDKSERIAFDRSEDTHLLNSVGMVYCILDHFRGYGAQLLEASLIQSQPRDEVTAVSFSGRDRFAVMIASWSGDIKATDDITLEVEIPTALPGFPLDPVRARIISLTNESHPYAAIRADLAAAGNLSDLFAAHPGTLAKVSDMAKDFPSARKMVRENLPTYQKLQQECLTLKPLPPGKAELGAIRGGRQRLTVRLQPNEVLVLVFNRYLDSSEALLLERRGKAQPMTKKNPWKM